VAKSRESADRRQRERAKQQKANAKRERRLNKNVPTDAEPGDETDAPAPEVEKVDEEALLAQLAKLHTAYDNEEISFDDFESQREELLSKLQVD
jgi:hypothetical protein